MAKANRKARFLQDLRARAKAQARTTQARQSAFRRFLARLTGSA